MGKKIVYAITFFWHFQARNHSLSDSTAISVTSFRTLQTVLGQSDTVFSGAEIMFLSELVHSFYKTK